MQDERDIVVFTDDEGNDFELEVMDYFFYNGQEYAVLSDADAEGEACGCEECAGRKNAASFMRKTLFIV